MKILQKIKNLFVKDSYNNKKDSHNHDYHDHKHSHSDKKSNNKHTCNCVDYPHEH